MIEQKQLNIWISFQTKNQLTNEQLKTFQDYYLFLIQENKKYNLTNITDLSSVIFDHFQDSIVLSKFIDLNKINTIADIGAGAGFPGIPLKIIYPELKIIFIEVIHKKLNFIKSCLKYLKLDKQNLFIDLDWRTFLRNTDADTNYDIDIFCSRAAISPKELIRIFKPSSKYKSSLLVYWASKLYLPTKTEQPFIIKKEDYTSNDKERHLIFFKESIK